ncbi:MAG: hypothetical protein FIA97_12330 [Methylococcaceae bacterium]|nr:hypothetical protein [Methylococcaceae bacterium]
MSARMVHWRLRHYADATLKLLIRRWQAWLFLLFASSPATMPLAAQIHAVGAPVRQAVEGGDPGYTAAAWAAMITIALAWSAVQTEALRGGSSWRFLRTQPLVARLERTVDLAVLLIADLPLLLPFAAYLASLPRSATDGAIATALALNLAALQQSVLRRSPAAIAIALSSSAAAFALCREPLQQAALLVLMLGPLVARHMPNRWTEFRCRALPAPKPRPTVNSGRSLLGNLIAIDIRVLTQRSSLPARLPPAIFTVLLTAFGWSWESIGLRQPVAAGLLLTGILVLAFRSAGLAVVLRTARTPLLPWFASLGVSARTHWLGDLAVMNAAFAGLASGPVFMLHRYSGAPRTFLVLPLGMAAVTLSAQLHRSQGTTRFLSKLLVAALFLAAGWWAAVAG